MKKLINKTKSDDENLGHKFNKEDSKQEKTRTRDGNISAVTAIVLLVMGIITIVVFVFGFVMAYNAEKFWIAERLQEMSFYSANIGHVVENYDDKNNMSMHDVFLKQTGMENTDSFIIDNDGKIIYCKEMAQNNESLTNVCTCDKHKNVKIDTDNLKTLRISPDGKLVSSVENICDQPCLVYADDLFVDGEEKGTIFICEDSNKNLMPYLVSFIAKTFASGIAVLIMAAVITLISLNLMILPLKKISKATQCYSKGDFEYRIKFAKHPRPVREYEQLATAMNAMAQSMSELDRKRSDFVANVSHELKTPMQTIHGFVDGILDGTIDREQESYYLQIVSNEVKRLTRLVQNMLNMSKMESGEIRIEGESLELDKMIISIMLSFEKPIEDKKINVEGLDKLPVTIIEADKSMINQVFYNLIDNAVKFTNENGIIGVKIVDGNNNDIICSVYNTGKAIDKDDIDHIFERFYKGDKSRGLDTKSTGLGLFITRNLVELHNGSICVESRDGLTTFTVTLNRNLY